MLLKPKYGRFRNDSVTSSDDLMQSLAMSGKIIDPSSVPDTPPPPVEPIAIPPSLVQPWTESTGRDVEPDNTTTFCMLIPKMPQWKFSNSLLNRSQSSISSGGSKDSGKASTSEVSQPSSGIVIPTRGPVASLTAVLNSCDPVCVGPCSQQAISKQRAVVGSSIPRGLRGMGTEEGGSGGERFCEKTKVDGLWLGGEALDNKGSFINRPSQGRLHPDKKISSTGASYIVRVSY